MFTKAHSTSGYFVLGGRQTPVTPPTFEVAVFGNLIGSRSRGHYALDTDMPEGASVNLPARDKVVHIWASPEDYPTLAAGLATIDSDLPQFSYVDKLDHKFGSSVSAGVVVNTPKDTHGSMALVFNQPLHVYGLFDTRLDTSFLMWTTDPSRLSRVLSVDPIRFLLYRFPLHPRTCLFLQGEAVCSKWFRWLKTSSSVLQAFNSLEHRLYGPP